MRIFGVDFTSAPRRRKPITCASCRLDGARLAVEALLEFERFDAFEDFLRAPGPWVAGLDFPFGQPRDLVAALGWPAGWEGYVSTVAGMEMRDFERVLERFRAGQPAGRKHRLRATDRLARSRSPMMLYGVPVGRMFFRGAPRLLRSGVAVPPCRPDGDGRTALEAYPALAARALSGARSYKHDTAARQTAARGAARADIVNALGGAALESIYGVRVRLPGRLCAAAREDPTGDRLDAVLCAVQAAWAVRSGPRYGIPAGADPDEGWIVDPVTAEKGVGALWTFS